MSYFTINEKSLKSSKAVVAMNKFSVLKNHFEPGGVGARL